MNKEIWKTIEEFPNYSVSNYGRVVNAMTDVIKVQSLNQQGIPSVLFIKDHVQHRRAVAVLVAHAFLKPHSAEHFQTPINLDGDRTNNHVDNLQWRPRWFAIKYHQQFNPGGRRGFDKPIEDVETGERFDSSWDAAIKYGLLDFDIYLATLNRTYVIPTGQRFRVLD